VLGYVIGKARRKQDPDRENLKIPADLRRRLRDWVDVDEVGIEGFWLWLRAVVPLLPVPEAPRQGLRPVERPESEETRELRRRMVVYARENSRLTVIGDQYARDNLALARRLKALEAALRTLAVAGHRVEVPKDEDAAIAVERYLPSRAARSR